MRILIALLPLILFYALESWAGLRIAVAAGMLAVIGDLTYTRWSEGRWSRIALISTPLVIGLGGVTVLLDDVRFTLVGPAVGDALFTTLLIGSRLLGGNLLLYALEDIDPTVELHPLQRRHVDALAWRLAVNLLTHAALVLWAMNRSREVWLFVAGPLQMIFIGAQVGLELGWLRWKVQPLIDAEEAVAVPPAA